MELTAVSPVTDLDEDALNAISKIYQEIYFIVATSCWRNGKRFPLSRKWKQSLNRSSKRPVFPCSRFAFRSELDFDLLGYCISVSDMSRACISYAIRRSKPIPVEGGQVGTDTGRHFHKALQPLLGFIVGCPQDARSHNVVHQVISKFPFGIQFFSVRR